MLSVPASLVAAWSTLKDDPIRLLLPAAGILLLQLAALIVIRAAAAALPWPMHGRDVWLSFVAWVGVVHLVRFALSTPLRASLIAAGARTLGTDAAPRLALPTLWLVEGAIAVTQVGAWLAIAVPGVLCAGGLVGARAITLATVVLAFALVGAAAASFSVRALLAFAPYEVVLAGRGPIAAVQRGWHGARGQRMGLAILMIVGDLLVGVGGLCCGAGALPGYPIGPLAVLHRWSASREER